MNFTNQLQHKNKTMNKKKKEKSQVIGFRLPYSVYESYERRCIELQIEMSEILRQAVQKFMQEKTINN